MKKIFIGFLVIFLVIISVALYGASKSGTIIRQAVEDFAPEVTGAPVSLANVNVSLLGGTAGLSDLRVGNPKGFKSDYAFKVDNMAVTIEMDSLLADVIRIKEVRIVGADLIYEIGSKGNNIKKIQNNIETYTKNMGLELSESDSEVKFIVDHIYITGTKVKLASDLLGGKGAGLTLPDIHLKNIGTEDKAASAGEVGTAIFGAINKGLGQVVTKDMLKNTVDDVKKKIGNIFK